MSAVPGDEPASDGRPLSERLAVAAQHWLPKRAMTTLAGQLARARGRGATQAVIRWFVARYGVDMTQAAVAELQSYGTFNDFFTRALRDGARPLARADLVCPVDGAISQFGPLDGEHLIQAKGHRYTATALLGGDAALSAHVHGGHFATLYLSPRDYHRIHMPCAGRLLRMIHVPGALFSVNPATARGVPGLFARNERVVCVFEGTTAADGVPTTAAVAQRPWVLVLVGATIVGSMATIWHGTVNTERSGRVREWTYHDRDIRLPQGAEMGRFLLGSTVVLLFPAAATAAEPPLRFNPDWRPGRSIRMGEVMATRDPVRATRAV